MRRALLEFVDMDLDNCRHTAEDIDEDEDLAEAYRRIMASIQKQVPPLLRRQRTEQALAEIVELRFSPEDWQLVLDGIRDGLQSYERLENVEAVAFAREAIATIQ